MIYLYHLFDTLRSCSITSRSSLYIIFSKLTRIIFIRYKTYENTKNILAFFRVVW